MKKFIKLFFVVLLVALLATSLCAFASSAESTDSVSTLSQLYIGNYDQEGAYVGMAHVVFGTVSNTTAEYGIIIKTSNDEYFKFPGKSIGSSGKFGIAIYQLADGDYSVCAYSGSDDARILGNWVKFTANKATYNVSFDLSKVGGQNQSISVAQGTSPDFTPDASALTMDGGIVGFFNEDGSVYDPAKVVDKDQTITAKWISDGVINSKTYNFVRADRSKNLYSVIGSTVPVDLSDGGSITMEFDVLSNGLGSQNTQYYFNILQNLPDLSTHKGDLSSTHYTGVTSNPAYTSTNAQYWGVISKTSNSPSSFDGSQLTYNTNTPLKSMFVTGKTLRIVYTAPTETTTGSVVFYNKTIGADDSTYVEGSYMKGLQLCDVAATDNNYFWFRIYGNNSFGNLQLKFNNFRVYSDSYGDCDLPVTVTGTGGNVDLCEWLPSYTVTYKNGSTTVATESVKQGNLTTAPDTSAISMPTNSKVEWLDADGNVFDFDTAIEGDITLSARFVAIDDIYNKSWDITGLFGNSTLVDLSDGSTLTMEFDVLDCAMGAANYNNYVWIVNSITYNRWGGYYFGVYGNWAIGSGYPVKYLTQNNLTGEGVVCSKNCSPTTMYVKGNSTRISYTAPTADKTGSIICYNKPIGATEWTETWSATNLTLNNVQDTSKVFMGIDWEGSHSLRVNNLRMYVNDGEYNLPCYSQNASHFTEYIPPHTVTYASNGFELSSESVVNGSVATAPTSVAGPTGATLTGWVDENGVDFDFATPVTRNMTLSAVWEYPTYNVGVPQKTNDNAQVGWLMTSTATPTGTGEKLTMEMDVLSSNFGNYNINIGISFFNYLGVSNNYASGFHDTEWKGNPMNSNHLTGLAWKNEDASDKTRPTFSEFNPAVVWAAGNSVKVVYTMPTATVDGSIEIYLKGINEDESAYTLYSTATDIKAGAVVNSGSKIMMGMIIQCTSGTTSAAPTMTVTNLRTYNESAELQFVKQHNLVFEEVTEA